MLRPLRLRARHAVIVTGLALGLILGAGSPAFAGVWQVQDGYESNPAATWWFDGSANAYGDFGGFDGVPHTGSKYATVYRFDAGWSSVARIVHLTPRVSHPTSCVAQIWLQEAPGTKVAVEIIEPSSWTYLALSNYTLPGDYKWHPYSSGFWSNGPVDVAFRVTVGSTGGFARVKADDLTVQCTY